METQAISDPNYKLILSAVEEAEALIDDSDSALIVPIAEDVKSAESAVFDAHSIVAGEISIAIDEAETVISKAVRKITDNADGLMVDAYKYMVLAGIPIPTESDVAFFESTGDPLRALGIDGANDAGKVIPPAPPPNPLPQPLPIGNPPPLPAVIPPLDPNNCYTNAFGDKVCCPAGWGYSPLIGCFPSNSQSGPPPAKDPGGCPPGLIPVDVGGNITANYRPPVGDFPYQLEVPVLYVDGRGPPFADWVLSTIYHVDPRTGLYTPVSVWVPPNTKICVNITTGMIGCSVICPAGWCEANGTPITPPPVPPPVPEPTPPPPLECNPVEPQQCPDPPSPFSPPMDLTGEFCDKIAKWITGIFGNEATVKDWLSMSAGSDDSSTIESAIEKALTGKKGALLPGLTERFKQWSGATNRAAVDSLGCTSAEFGAVTLMQGVAAFIQQWFAFLPPQFVTALNQASNTLCQSQVPTGGQADAAFLSNTISHGDWVCYHKASGNMIREAEQIMQAGRTRINAKDAYDLFRKGLIAADEYNTCSRESGVLNPMDAERIEKTMIYWQSPSVLITQMKRDVFDPIAIEQSGLDVDFDKKYTAEAEAIGNGIGLTREQAKLEWMAHWQLPSYTMGREFLYRFNDPDEADWLRFTEDDFENMLKQDDWAPGYIKRMIAMAYHPVSMSDATRAYMIHVSDNDELHKQLKKVGYSEETAAFMVRYYDRRRTINDNKTAGLPTLRMLTNQYARCEITNKSFRETVAKLAISEEQERAAVDAASIARDTRERKEAIRTIKRPYILGIYDENDVMNEFAQYDFDIECIDEMLTNWKRERLRKDKFFTGEQLCKLRERGLINADQHLQALIRLGWKAEDAIVVMKSCEAQVSERERKRQEALAEKAQRLFEKEMKAQEKAKRLAECGPVPCPKNRASSTPPSVVGQSTQGQG